MSFAKSRELTHRRTILSWGLEREAHEMISTDIVSTTTEPTTTLIAARDGIDLLRTRLRAVVHLAGSVRPSKLTMRTGRPLLDLPLDQGVTLLDDWRTHVSGLAQRLELEQLPMRVMVNRDSPSPTAGASDGRAVVTIEHDPEEYRGTAGLLRDVTRSYKADDLVLVIAGTQVLFEPLAEIALELADGEADVSLLSHADGTPSALMLIRVRALDAVKPRGFLDLKEQFLPELATSRLVKAIESPRRIAAPIRTLSEYIVAVREFHEAKAGGRAQGPFSEHWRPTFRLAEAGASVAEGARIHDSVVLDGGRVENGACVVHSVVTRTGVVAANELIVDSVVGGGNGTRNGNGMKRKGGR